MSTDQDIAFPTLSDDDLAALGVRGHTRDVHVGDVLFAAGDRNFCFYVVLEGAIEIVDATGEEPRTVAEHRRGQFTGEVTMLTADALAAGGQAGTSSRIENYLGFPTGISGAELTRNALVQAQRFGARITVPCAVRSLGLDGGDRIVTLADGTRLRTRCVLVASGVEYRKLDVPRFAEFEGDGHLRAVHARSGMGEARTFGTSSLFLFLGADPNTAWLRGCVELDRQGFVLTGSALPPDATAAECWRLAGRSPFLLETSLPGVFAAGDVRSGSIKRVASAVGDGSMSVSFVHAQIQRPV